MWLARFGRRAAADEGERTDGRSGRRAAAAVTAAGCGSLAELDLGPALVPANGADAEFGFAAILQVVGVENQIVGVVEGVGGAVAGGGPVFPVAGDDDGAAAARQSIAFVVEVRAADVLETLSAAR